MEWQINFLGIEGITLRIINLTTEMHQVETGSNDWKQMQEELQMLEETVRLSDQTVRQN